MCLINYLGVCIEPVRIERVQVNDALTLGATFGNFLRVRDEDAYDFFESFEEILYRKDTHVVEMEVNVTELCHS